jgi:hypothetical protein
MPSISRNLLIPAIHKLIEQGGFAGRIGEAALLADETNLEILVNAFPKLLIEGQALENQWTQRLSTSKTVKTAKLKLVWNL